MNRLFYLMVFAICLAANCVLAAPGAPVPAASTNIFGSSLHASNRVVRQAPDFQPPPPPPPPEMFMNNFSRKRREAKGGGSMPTRKG
uniref:Secreted protein n=1 Tax=Heliothis virescens TaxID=7102 RepID=A0A2A4JM17_HELVI